MLSSDLCSSSSVAPCEYRTRNWGSSDQAKFFQSSSVQILWWQILQENHSWPYFSCCANICTFCRRWSPQVPISFFLLSVYLDWPLFGKLFFLNLSRLVQLILIRVQWEMYVGWLLCESKLRKRNLSAYLKNQHSKLWYFAWDWTPITGSRRKYTTISSTSQCPVIH